jgi:FG-GAP repeat
MKQLSLFPFVLVSLLLSVPAVASGPRAPIAELTASDGKADSRLGESVAISDGTVFAGVIQLGNGGSIYVFERPASGWGDMTQTAELTIPHSHFFFNALAASGDTVVAGVQGAGPNGTGALYVFEKPAGGWKNMTPTAVLSPAFGDRFGSNVAIAGDTIVAGDPGCSGDGDFGPGRALIFQKPADGWHDMHETAALSASDSQGCDDYGISVGASGNTIVVGADLEGSGPLAPGEVYVFEKPAGGWTNMTETAELNLLEGFPGDGVGGTVAIGGNTIVSSMNNPQGFSRILVFEKRAGGWTNGTQTATLLQAADGPLAVNPQGTAVAANGDSAGIVKVYEEPASGWQDTSTATYRFSRPPSDFLGTGLALGSEWLAAGAGGTTVNGHALQGAAFLFFK